MALNSRCASDSTSCVARHAAAEALDNSSSAGSTRRFYGFTNQCFPFSSFQPSSAQAMRELETRFGYRMRCIKAGFQIAARAVAAQQPVRVWNDEERGTGCQKKGPDCSGPAISACKS